MSTSRPDRRSKVDRRVTGDRRSALTLVAVERRTGGPRRSGFDRRGFSETPAEDIRNALQLLTGVAGAPAFDLEVLRDVDAALVRLRLALGKLEQRR